MLFQTAATTDTPPPPTATTQVNKSLSIIAMCMYDQLYVCACVCVFWKHIFTYETVTKIFQVRVIFFAEKRPYCNNHKYWDTLSTYHTAPKIWNSSFYYLLMCPKYCCMCGKQCWPWSDATFCGIWSGSTLFAKAYMSQYLGLLRYLEQWYRVEPHNNGNICSQRCQ